MDFNVGSAAVGSMFRTVYNSAPRGCVKRPAPLAHGEASSPSPAADKYLLVIMPPEYPIIVERALACSSTFHIMRALIIGGGIVGLATAFRLGQKLPDADIT